MVPTNTTEDLISTSNPIIDNILTPEECIQLAIQAIQNSPFLSDGTHEYKIRSAARDFNVPRSTLANRLNGVQTWKEAHEHERRLTISQEEIVVEWVKVMGRRGLPVTGEVLTDYARDICGKEMGKNWSRKFVERHTDLKIKRTTTLEDCRARSLNPTIVADFFEVLKTVILEYDIPRENIYNADEKGIQLGIGQSVAAIVDRSQKTVQQVENGNREMVTVIETVCADGTALPPSVIFQGARRNLEWGRSNPSGARYHFKLFLNQLIY
jgi:hypothetical protein